MGYYHYYFDFADHFCLSFGIGDWICKTCARSLGIKTGIEGHEWEAEEAVCKLQDQSSSQEEDNGALVDSDDEEVPVRLKKRRKVLEVVDSDSDDE